MKTGRLCRTLPPGYVFNSKGELEKAKPSCSSNVESLSRKGIGPMTNKPRRGAGPALNKTEQAFLEYLKREYVLGWIHYAQDITIRLGFDCRYTPDFLSVYMYAKPLPAVYIIAWEVKGFFRDDAKVKLQVAARMYPWITFKLVRKIKNGWDIKEVRQ